MVSQVTKAMKTQIIQGILKKIAPGLHWKWSEISQVFNNMVIAHPGQHEECRKP